MRVKPGILIFISLLLLVGTVAAVGIPDTVVLISNNSWVVANGVDQKIITVRVLNTTLGYEGVISGVLVNFNVTDPSYGTMTPLSNLTETNGEAQSTFKVKTKSGIATITAMTSFGNNLTIYQNIDHNSAYFADFNHPINGTVASEVPFTVSLTDQYRNPVDNRRGNHIVNLHVHGPFPDDCGFAEAGYGHDSARILDANGNTSVNVKLTSKIGDNNIAMDGYQSIPNQLAWISAEAQGKPFSMTQVYSPSGSPPTLPADGVSYFTIIYNLFDEYGNPTNKQFIWVNTSVLGEEQKQYLSNNMGQVTVQYGPRSSIGEIDITATAVANSTLTLTQRVKFKNTGAEIISLTANPDTMPSQDANPLFTSNIIATVADISGNAVDGETVNLILENITYDASYNVTADPNLLTSSAVTDVYGRALVQFRPGSFTTVGNPGYNATATGHCIVNATWRNSTKKLPVTWKNYPYLSVSTSVNPHTVEINKTIDVTIEFRGDGWALQPDPIEVVLCTDRSGSMLYDNPDRMHSVREAGKVFIDALKIGTDKVGLVTFGMSGTISSPGVNSGIAPSQIHNTYTVPKTYSSYATFDRNLTTDFTLVKSDLDTIVPDYATPMRLGVYKSVKELNSLGQSSGTIKAIVLLSDGDYNYYGDPLARGAGSTNSASWYWTNYGNHDLNPAYYQFSDISNQNLSAYAKENNIRIYSIGYGNTLTAGGRTTLRILAEGTEGKYYDATATDIADVYLDIAEELKDTAGVNATMTTDFDKINVTGFAMDGDQIYDYVYHPTESTKINWQDGITNVTNQSDDWIADNKLDFNIGTIKVGQYWNATFRLKIKQSGLIDVFGKNSTVSFNGGNETLYLPQTFITVIPNLTVTEITVKTITLDNLTCTETGEIKALFPVMWNTNYTGNKTLTEKVYYRVNTGPWVQFDTKTHHYDPLTLDYVDFAQLDVTKLPPGDFKIQVRATASDAPDAIAETVSKTVGGRGKTFIKLEAPPFLDDTQFFNQNPWGIVDSRSI